MSDLQSILPKNQEALPIALLRAREATLRKLRPVLKEHGITEQQWRILRALDEQDDLDITTLSERCALLMPSLSRLIRTLEYDKLVERTHNKTDSRRSIMKLSSKGQTLVDLMAPKVKQVFEDLLLLCGEEDINALIKQLITLEQKLNA